MASRRVPAVIAAMLVTLTVGAACSRGATPSADETSAESTQMTSETSGTSETAAAPSDEDQVRDTVMAFQQAYNTQNWDAYLELMCPSWRAQYTGPVLEMTKQARIDQGLTTMSVTGVRIVGDEATATVDAQNELLGTKTFDLRLVREDGWRVCTTGGIR